LFNDEQGDNQDNQENKLDNSSNNPNIVSVSSKIEKRFIINIDRVPPVFGVVIQPNNLDSQRDDQTANRKNDGVERDFNSNLPE
jgi:hypothetical protein